MIARNSKDFGFPEFMALKPTRMGIADVCTSRDQVRNDDLRRRHLIQCQTMILAGISRYLSDPLPRFRAAVPQATELSSERAPLRHPCPSIAVYGSTLQGHWMPPAHL